MITQFSIYKLPLKTVVQLTFVIIMKITCRKDESLNIFVGIVTHREVKIGNDLYKI